MTAKRPPIGRSDYMPGMARIGEPTPQSHPAQFSSEDLLAEAKYLLKMNAKYGSHELRTMGYLKLTRLIVKRGDVDRLAAAGAGADGMIFAQTGSAASDAAGWEVTR